jgi:heme/copper-type cytochrome/quinol oxidase subunit 4
MTPHETARFKGQIRTHLRVFASLLVGTMVAVGIAVSPLSMTPKLAAVLAIALVQAVLVAGVMMHLVSEKRPVFTVLAFTGIFFAGLVGLTLWAMHDHPKFTQFIRGSGAGAAPAVHHVP